jgi:transposase
MRCRPTAAVADGMRDPTATFHNGALCDTSKRHLRVAQIMRFHTVCKSFAQRAHRKWLLPGDPNFGRATQFSQCFIGHLKEQRRIATRYDKLANSFLGFVLLGCIRIWASGCSLSTRPKCGNIPFQT